jgi:hypothetical protein
MYQYNDRLTQLFTKYTYLWLWLQRFDPYLGHRYIGLTMTQIRVETLYPKPNIYVLGSKSFRPDIQKPRQMEIGARDMQYFLKDTQLLVNRCEKCVVIKGDCIEKRESWFTLKSWSGRKLLDPTTYIFILGKELC